MAKPTKKYLLELVAQHGPEIAKAFKASITSIKDSAQVGALIAMLEKGDVATAAQAVGLDPAAFRRLDQSIVTAFEEGGGKTAQTIPAARSPDGLRMVVQFGVRNDRAEQWLKDHSSTLIREIIEDQRQVIRTVLADGMARGLNPRDVALDLVGRLDPVTRTRQGGVIGLTSQQVEYVQRYRAELLSGDPAQFRNALARVRRDRKFDGAIRKAIAAGEPIDPAAAEKMVGRYSDRLLLLRGETIGRTEAMTALHQSQEEAYQQAIDKGALQGNHVRYFWRTAADERVRHSHAQIPGMNEKGVLHGTPFSSPLGPIRFPGDPNASAANRLGCRCWREPKVDFLAQAVEAEGAAPKPRPRKTVPKWQNVLPQQPMPLTEEELAPMPPDIADWHRDAWPYVDDVLRRAITTKPPPYLLPPDAGGAFAFWDGGILMSWQQRAMPKELRSVVWRHEFGHYLDHDLEQLGISEPGAFASSKAVEGLAKTRDAWIASRSGYVDEERIRGEPGPSQRRALENYWRRYGVRGVALDDIYKLAGSSWDRAQMMMDAIRFLNVNEFLWLWDVNFNTVEGRTHGQVSDFVEAVSRCAKGGLRFGSSGHGAPYYARYEPIGDTGYTIAHTAEAFAQWVAIRSSEMQVIKLILAKFAPDAVDALEKALMRIANGRK